MGIGGSLGSGRGILRSKKNKGDLSGRLASSMSLAIPVLRLEGQDSGERVASGEPEEFGKKSQPKE